MIKNFLCSLLIFLLFSSFSLGLTSEAQYQNKVLKPEKKSELKEAIQKIKIPKPSKSNDFTSNVLNLAGSVTSPTGVGGLLNGFALNWVWNQVLKATNSANGEYRSYSKEKAEYWADLIIQNNQNVKYLAHDVVTDPYSITLQYNNEIKKLKEPIEGVQKVYEIAEFPYTKISRIEDVILAYHSFRVLQGVDLVTSTAPDITVEFPDPTGISNGGLDKFFVRAFNFDLQDVKGLEKVKFPTLNAFSFFALIYFILWFFSALWDWELRRMRDSEKRDYYQSLTRSLINRMTDLISVFAVVFFIASGSLVINSLNTIYLRQISGTELCKEVTNLGYVQSYCKTWKSINHHCLNNSLSLKCSFIAGGMDLSLDNIINSDTSTFDAYDGNLLGQGMFFMVSNTNALKVLLFQAIFYILIAIVSIRFIFPSIKMMIFFIFSPMLIYEFGAKEFYQDLLNDFKGLFYSYTVFITLSIFLRNMVLSSLDPLNLFIWGAGIILGMIIIPSMISSKLARRKNNINLFNFAYGTVRKTYNLAKKPFRSLSKK
jgi:hypothetical protein